METESTLPKTYSTRRGPLLLYSQSWITVEATHESDSTDRRKQAVRGYTQEVEHQLSTLKELTAAILNYTNNQFIFSRLGPPFFPSLHFPFSPDLQRTNTLPVFTSPEQPSLDLCEQFGCQQDYSLDSADRKTAHPENQRRDEDEEHKSGKRLRLDLFLQIPNPDRTPSPPSEPQPWVHYVAMTPEEPEEPQGPIDIVSYHPESSQNTETNHQETGEKVHHLNRVCDVTDGQGSVKTSADNSDSDRSISRKQHGRKVGTHGTKQLSPKPEHNTTSGLLPHLTEGQSVCSWEKTDKMQQRWEDSSNDEHYAQHLPSIAESRTGSPNWMTPVQTQQDAHQTKSDRAGFQPQENLKRVHKQPLVLPQLFPERLSGKKRGAAGGEIAQRHYFKKVEQVGEGGGEGGLLSDKGCVIMLDPGEDTSLPPAGVLGCVAGRKGPGKQSSLAFLKNPHLNLQELHEPTCEDKGVIRGILPLELRDLQTDKPVGCLIVGPDGEILKLSLYENSQEAPENDEGSTCEQAFQVLSQEGEKLPWLIMLQPEQTHAERMEPNTDVHVEEIQLQQLLDLHGSAEIHSPSSRTDPGTMKQMKSAGAEAVNRLKQVKKDTKNKVRMPSLREKEGVEEQSEGHTETDTNGEEILGRTGQISSFTGQKNNNQHEATGEEAFDQKRRNMKTKDTEEAARTTGKKDLKRGSSAGSDGQKTGKERGSQKEKSGSEKGSQKEKTGSDAQSIRSNKQEEKKKVEAAETPDQSALVTDAKKKRGDKEGRRGEMTKNPKKGEQGEVRRKKKDPTLKHKELVFVNQEDLLEKEETKINQDSKTASHSESIKSPPATEKPNKPTKDTDPADTDHLSTHTDKHSSSVQSLSSLRSTAAASRSNLRSSRRSVASSGEGAGPAGTMGLTSSHGRLSSCSTVMVTEEQLMLNPVKPEFSRPRKSQKEEEEEAAALRLAQRAERRRQEVERKRREKEEEERRQQEREQTEDRMKNELEEDRRRRAEELRLKRMAEEEKKKKQEEEEKERARREQEQRERERRRQEEKNKQMERLRRMREEEERRRKAELERLRLEEERRKEEENKKLQQMDENERMEYLQRKEQEEEDRRKNEEERRIREEEAAQRAAEEARLQAEQLNRQMALLQQQLAFKRGLMLEAEGLEKTQGISRPWVYSYFTLLQLLGLKPNKSDHKDP
ncbi:uncharacterized protein KIAA2012-like isoform X2 [Xyrichtys novacula]|nr:uncharacterized protein KIAA2012-like isoform X2 [Xyrichtys novacula]